MAPSTQLRTGCEVCGKPEAPELCPSCNAVRYCTPAHREADFENNHSAACLHIRKARIDLEAEEADLDGSSNDDNAFSPPNPFLVADGTFWILPETRDYMRARRQLVSALENVRTRDSVKMQLDHLYEMMWLDRNDHMCVRYVVPAKLLRLGRDQECYDFIKWWCSAVEDSEATSMLELPFLNTKGADVMEPVEYLCTVKSALSMKIGATLLKLRLALDFNDLGKVARHRNVLRSRIVKQGLSDCKELLWQQAATLYSSVQEDNSHFWAALISPNGHLAAEPEAYTPGSMEEAGVNVRLWHDVWLATPGAMDWVARTAI